MPIQIISKKTKLEVVDEKARIEVSGGQTGVYYEDFEGDYEYNPLLTTQIVPCNDKHMVDDITFNMIQTRETPLETGGVLFEILG